MFHPQCVCGHNIRFRRGQKEKRCPVCLSYCYRDRAGYWSVNSNQILFSPREDFLKRVRKHDGRALDNRRMVSAL